MDLTPEERRQIYEEEKARLESTGADERATRESWIKFLLLAFVILGSIGIVIYILVNRNASTTKSTAQAPPQRYTSASAPPNSIRGASPDQNKGVTPDSVLTIKFLKTYQSGPFAYVDFSLTNDSERQIKYWEINADLFDKANKYLANGMGNGSNLRPGQTITGKIMYGNIDSTEINSWKPRIGYIKLDVGGGRTADGEPYFSLKELKP